MHKSNKINRQIVGLITFIIFITLFICCLLNTYFLGDFYLFQKRNDMRMIFWELKSRCEADNLYSEENESDLSIVFDNYSVSVLVTNSESGDFICSNTDEQSLLDQLDYSLNLEKKPKKILRETGDYSIFTQNYPNTNEDYMVLIGYLPDKSVVFIRATMDGIEQTADMANIFLIYTSVFAIILAIFISNYLVTNMTKPLFDIIGITKKISNFEFDTKYKPQKIYNELDDLGEHINEMSTTLKRSIDQLRLANENLKKDLEIREENENMRKEFVSNVSHELKTPIALIQGYAEGLQEGIMDDENSRQIYLDVIIDEANKMNRLVREMLILNQLEAGRMNMDLVDFDLTELIDGVVESNRIYLDAQNITYSFVNKEVCMVNADEFLVEQVVTNFISNAIHYVMNENVIVVKYDFVKKGKVRISVFNSGNNIAKKDIKHIWEKFYKADKARSREYGGSGIGLSVVKATMELLHEKFGVENLSNGVEFWCELPLAKDTKINKNS